MYIYFFYCFYRLSINRGDDPGYGGSLSLSCYLFAFYLTRATYFSGKFRRSDPRKTRRPFLNSTRNRFVLSPSLPYLTYRQNLVMTAVAGFRDNCRTIDEILWGRTHPPRFWVQPRRLPALIRFRYGHRVTCLRNNSKAVR